MLSQKCVHDLKVNLDSLRQTVGHFVYLVVISCMNTVTFYKETKGICLQTA